MSFDKEIKLGDTFQELPKSKFQVQHADNIGHFPFYTSGDSVLTHSEFNVDDEIIFLATGGKANVKFHSGKAAYSTDTYAIKGKDHSSKYLYYLLLNNLSFIDRNFFSGSGLKHLQKKDFRNWVLSFPDDTSEEETIVQFLSSLDHAIASTEQLISKYRRIKTGLLNDLLTRGIDEHGNLRSEKTHKYKVDNGVKVPIEWNVSKLPAFCSYQNGKAFPSKEYNNQGIRLVKAGNLAANGFVDWNNKHQYFINVKYWDESPEYQVFENELLMNLTAQSLEDEFLGRVCITPKGTNCLLNQRIARIVPKSGVDTIFLWWAFKSRLFRKYVDLQPSGTKVKHLYNNDLDNALLAIPSDINEQKRIADLLLKELNIISQLKGNVIKMRFLRTGLMQDLLSGKMRVK